MPDLKTVRDPTDRARLEIIQAPKDQCRGTNVLLSAVSPLIRKRVGAACRSQRDGAGEGREELEWIKHIAVLCYVLGMIRSLHRGRRCRRSCIFTAETFVRHLMPAENEIDVLQYERISKIYLERSLRGFSSELQGLHWWNLDISFKWALRFTAFYVFFVGYIWKIKIRSPTFTTAINFFIFIFASQTFRGEV